MDSASEDHGWPTRLWGAALVLAVGFGWIISAAMSTSGQEGTTDEQAGLAPLGPTIEIPGPAAPLLQGGEMVSQARAEAMVGYPVVIPSDSLASKATLTEIWAQGETDEVALRFSTGIRIYLARWPAGKDPAASLARQANEAGAGRVDTVGGQPVWVLPKDAQDQGFPPQANVTMVVSGVEVNIWGDAPTDQLIRIASTLVDET